ncbi:MAG: hypothetical protein Q8P57_03460 [Candidatus Pacearchaeota archaeon]|nr:hypothetical protein [Candidatus Pacearchaeota archaeon]
MDYFIREIFEKKDCSKAHKYFIRFGKGDYKRRFIISFNKGKNIKIKSSFELANVFVDFVSSLKEGLKFSGKILMKEKVLGEDGKKKGGSFVYEVFESNLEKFENAYYYLIDTNSGDIVLKIKKAIPKPGKNEEKIDDKFCVIEIDLKYWEKAREKFFWDVPECKKAVVEHEVVINDIVLPKDVEDPVEIRALAKRKGKIIRKITADGKEILKETDFEA